ncbi:hypothetical protein GC093_21450 [Paenibacillus sp. LMG 31456]|uniref:Uncharacterized protein n=1 Tax=Paenibacillus foliorum TaxID=2654974 RepID=A0A972K3C8_9BACL|nr:hypothetical protein [Paenibacillus foliorum]NOU95768.1 hypothetical protein [Paenibacillus foliorum]
MSITFIEYQVSPEHRAAYSDWMKRVRANYPELEVYEGTDQPGLFVELWNGQSHQDFCVLKEARVKQSSEQEKEQPNNGRFDKIDWNELHNWAIGGVAKIHIWHFGKVR